MRGLRRSLWWWMPLGAIALVAFGWLAWYRIALWQLNRIKDEIRAAGLPMTAEEVIPARIPDDKNAAPLLKRADAIWKQIKDRGDFIDARLGSSAPGLAPEKFDQARLAQLQAQMQWPEMQEFVQLLQEASRRPAAVFERDYAKGLAMDTGPSIPLFSAVQFLGTKAWLAAREGHQKEAAEDVTTCARLASFGLRDVFLIEWMIGASFDRISIGAAQSVIAALPPGSFKMEDWQALDDLWAAHAAEARGDLVRTIDGERVLLGAWIFEKVMLGRISLWEYMARLYAMDPKDAATWRRMTWIHEKALAPLLVSDYAAYLRLMLTVRQAFKNGEIGQLKGETFARSIPRWAVISRAVAPTFDGTMRLLEEYEVNLQLGRLGLALEDFRARTGKYPASLQELGLPHSAITDPFTGQPFVYRPDGDSVIVYSVGFDRADDGGKHSPGKERRDIVWQVKRD